MGQVWNESMKKWDVQPCDRRAAEKIAAQLDLPEAVAVLLQTRGVTRREEMEALLCSDLTFSDPFLMADMDKAAKRILTAVDHFETIAVYGDYDADGVTATAMLYSYLESCGANVLYYIPEREAEGYGLNLNAIDTLRKQDIDLIITVDNGIASVEEVDYANSVGIDVVVTDHHRPREVLPAACAVVDPYRADCKSPFKCFSGVGVAFKLIMALEGEDCDITSLLDNYADLVAIGTIGDVVPLTGENRSFVRAGLESISRTDRLGLRALTEQAGMEGRRFTAGNVAFTLVPRINATGRIGSSDRAVRLLVSEFPEEAAELAAEVCDDNTYRKQIENEIFEKALEQLRQDPRLRFDRVLVLSGENWHHGVIGIVSSRVTELFGKPSVIISYSGDEAKGSGRSVEGFSLFQAVCSCEKLLTKFGGHPMAAGLSLPTENIDAFREKINRYAASLAAAMPVPTLQIDCLLEPSELTTEIPEQIRLLEPFGTGNPPPIFGLFGAKITEITPVGGGKHLRVSVTKRPYTVRCMRFGVTLEEFPYRIGDIVDLAVTLDAREYNGRNTLSVFIRDIRPASLDEDRLIAGWSLYDKARREEPLTREELEAILPKREEFAAIYRQLRADGGFSGPPEVLLSRLEAPGMGIQKLLTALDILKERRLIRMEQTGMVLHILLNHTEKKVDLFQSEIILNLRALGKGR